ncbi:MAG: hypothetical protein R3F39_05125 [Myxococcota bacterium]
MQAAVWIVSLAMVGAASVSGPEFALAPGFERVYARVAQPLAGELPEGFELARVSVPMDRVEALYAPRGEKPANCEAAPLCLTLHHPSAARAGDRVAGLYAIRVQGRAAPADALVDGIAARLEGMPAHAPWREVQVRLPPREAPPAAAAGAQDASVLEARFRALIAADPDLVRRLERVEVEPASATYHLRGDDGGEALVELIDRGPGQDDPAEVTRSFYIRALGPLSSPPDLALRLHRAVMAADDGSLRLAPRDVMASGERPALHWALIALSCICLALLLVATPWVLRAAFRVLGRDALLLALLAIGAALRLALPGRLVEMGIGYQLVRFADALTLPRYGAGTTTLHHLVFQVAGTDHRTMLWTHAVLGALTLPIAAALGSRLLAFGGGRRGALFFAGALALTPALLRSDLTESNLVPVLWALWTALLAWRELSGASRVLVTAAGLAFAGLSRPEMIAVAPALWLALERPWRTPRAAAVTLGLVALALAPQIAFVTHVIGYETTEQSLHLTKGLSLDRLLGAIARNGVFDPRVTPLAVPLLALTALAHRGARRHVALWLAGGLAWLYVYAVDLSGASIPRLHVVAIIPFSLAAAWTAGRLADKRAAWGLLAAALWIASAVPTAVVLWAPSNEDTDQALFERASASVPADSPYTLAVLASSDAPDAAGHFTHRHVPVYRFPAGEVAPLAALVRASADDSAPAYYLQTTSCYAELGRKDSGESGLLGACAAVHAHFRLEPVFVEQAPNHGNPVHQELGYYGPDPSFEVGLWRVRPR